MTAAEAAADLPALGLHVLIYKNAMTVDRCQAFDTQIHSHEKDTPSRFCTCLDGFAAIL